MPTTTTVPTPRKLRKPATLGIAVAGRIAGIGRSVSYEAARSGQLLDGVPVLKIGQRYRVPVAALEAALGIDILDHLSAGELDE